MARYDYRCATCEVVYEASRPMSEADAPSNCPNGHVGATRLLAVFATVSGRGEVLGCAPSMASGPGCGGACACRA